jgi:LmbE family N-acetylglucosaminyl deacetylase
MELRQREKLETTVDFLAVSPYPDGAEIWCGGLLLKLKDWGYRTGIVHITVGNMGSRGTPEVQHQELTAAAQVLRLDHAGVLDFQDCRVTDDFEGQLRTAAVVSRTFEPYRSPGRRAVLLAIARRAVRTSHSPREVRLATESLSLELKRQRS